MPTRLAKIVVTVGALLVVVVRFIWPELKVDAVTLGLLAIAILPWLSNLIKSAELPGGFKIEFRDVQAAGAKVTLGAPAPAPSNEMLPRPSYLEISDIDPNLALVGLRIEIEKRIRALAERYEISEKYSLVRMADELRKRGVLTDPSMSGLQELIMAGNQAAHGADVDPRAAAWVFDFGPQVLAVLDAKM